MAVKKNTPRPTARKKTQPKADDSEQQELKTLREELRDLHSSNDAVVRRFAPVYKIEEAHLYPHHDSKRSILAEGLPVVEHIDLENSRGNDWLRLFDERDETQFSFVFIWKDVNGNIRNGYVALSSTEIMARNLDKLTVLVDNGLDAHEAFALGMLPQGMKPAAAEVSNAS